MWIARYPSPPFGINQLQPRCRFPVPTGRPEASRIVSVIPLSHSSSGRIMAISDHQHRRFHCFDLLISPGPEGIAADPRWGESRRLGLEPIEGAESVVWGSQ